MRVLYAGFRGKNNASCRLVSSFSGEKLLLTNSFQGIHREIDHLRGTYDCVFLFGVCKELSHAVRIETCAEIGQHTVYSQLDPGQICSAFLANGIPCEIRTIPTHYLCNAAYYRLLVKYNANVVLIHIPGRKHIEVHRMDVGIRNALADLSLFYTDIHDV